MSGILDNEPKSPTSVRYLVLLSAGSLFIFDLLTIMTITTLGTQGQNFLSGIFLPITTTLSALSLVEWYYLRRSNSWKVGGLVYAVELVKTYVYGFYIPPLYNEFVGGGTNTFFFIPIISILSVGLFTANKLAPKKYEWLTNRPLAKRFINLLPTLVIISLFMGTYLVEISGLAPTRQTQELLPWQARSINWDAFGPPPDWNARYYLEDLLSQFLNGISFPDKPIFNVTNIADGASPIEPLTYWRLAALTRYEFEDREPYYTDWNQLDSTVERLFSSESDLFSSSKIPDNLIGDSSTTGIFRVDIPLDLSTSLPEPQISASFPYYIPTTWNDVHGGFIDINEANYPNPDSITVTSTGQVIFPVSVDVKEVQPSIYNSSNGIKLAITINDADTQEATGITQYTTRYVMPDYTKFAALSGTRADYQTAVDSQTWEAIKALYLQIPSTPGVDLPSNVDNYASWAPNVVGNATLLNKTTATVYQQIVNDLEALAANGTLGLTFDTKMWFRQYATGTTPRPDPYEDFNEWFITEKKGTSLHFASLLATVLRLQGIPTRIAYGFIGGNDTLGNFQKRVITQRFIHTWVEALVPIKDVITGNVELRWMPLWFHLDPLFAYLVGAAAMTQQQSQTQAFLYDPIEYQKQTLSQNFDFSKVWRSMNITEVSDPTPDHIIGFGSAVTINIGAMMIGGDVIGGAIIPQGIPNLKIKLGVKSADNTTETTFLKNFEVTTDANGIASFTFVFNTSLIINNQPNFGAGNYIFYAEANTTIMVNGQQQNITLQAWSPDVYSFNNTEPPSNYINSDLESTINNNNKQHRYFQRFSPEEMKFIKAVSRLYEKSLQTYTRYLEWKKAHQQGKFHFQATASSTIDYSDIKQTQNLRDSKELTSLFSSIQAIIKAVLSTTSSMVAPFFPLFNVLGTIPTILITFHRKDR